MIPTFPKFKKLDLRDKDFIEKFTKRFPPYSDYNFTSMWCWNTKNDISLSLLNDNLVVEFSDYITRRSFYSFLGTSHIDGTIEKVINFSRKNGITDSLKLIGHVTAALSQSRKFAIQEDPDNFDYILSIPALMTYSGNYLRGKRNFVHRFSRKYRSRTTLLNITDSKIQKKILERFFIWADQKNFSIDETRNEFTAIARVLDKNLQAKLVSVGVFINNELVGFSISEVIGNGYALLHFEKCDSLSYVGAYPFVMQRTAEILNRKGCKYINYEQDLGILGLRKGKASYNPSSLLKKYIVSSVEN